MMRRIYFNGRRLFPAGAGVILFDNLSDDLAVAVPRRGGGDPQDKKSKGDGKHCSPQGRG